jgi:hypothetical protein
MCCLCLQLLVAPVEIYPETPLRQAQYEYVQEERFAEALVYGSLTRATELPASRAQSLAWGVRCSRLATRLRGDLEDTDKSLLEIRARGGSFSRSVAGLELDQVRVQRCFAQARALRTDWECTSVWQREGGYADGEGRG